jgi:hypothetical protein
MLSLILAGLLAGATLQTEEVSDVPGAHDEAATKGPVWLDSHYNAAVAQARDQGSLLLVAFLPEWSDFSNKLRAETLPDPTVSGELCGLLCLEVDVDDPRGAQIQRLHQVTSFPALVLVGADGRIEDRIDGFIPAAPLVGELQRIKSGQGTVSDFQARSDAAPDDLAIRSALATKLVAVGRDRDAGRLYNTIRADDPTGASVTGARLQLQDAIDDIVAAAGPDGPPAWDTTPLMDALESIENERARFEGFARLADIEQARGQPGLALEALRSAWQRIPPTLVLDWGMDLVFIFWEREDVVEGEPELMLEVAEQVAAWAEEVVDPEGDDHGYTLPAGPDETPEMWLSRRLDALALAAFSNGDVDRAVALAERCQTLWPDNEEYAGRVGLFLAGR